MLADKKDLYLLGYLYSFEAGNTEQIIEYYCPKFKMACYISKILRDNKIPFHLEMKGIRPMIITKEISSYSDFLLNKFGLQPEDVSEQVWPFTFKELSKFDRTPFIDGIFEGGSTYSNSDNTINLIIENKNTTDEISEFLILNKIKAESFIAQGATGIYGVKVKSVPKFLEDFLNTNKYTKFKNNV